MAQKYVVQLVDDLTNTPIEDGDGESVHFALDGVSYAIDLTTAHAEDLRGVLARYVDAGRKAEPAGRTKSSSTPARAAKTDLKEVREWANANGYTVSTRGRIPAEVQTAFSNR